MDDAAVLADGDHRIAFGNTAHHRRVAAQRIGQHALVAGHAHAGERYTFKQFAAGIALAQQQLAVPAGNVALQVAADDLMGGTLVALGERRAVTQAPGAQIQACPQTQVAAAVALAAVVAGAVIDECGGDAVIAQFRRHEAARSDGLGGLRNADGQLQFAAVEGGAGPLHQRRQIHTGTFIGRQCFQEYRPQWQRVHQRRGQAGHGDLRVVFDDKTDVLAAHELAVDMHIHSVVAGRQGIAVGVAGHVDGLAANQEAFTELDRCSDGVHRHASRKYCADGRRERPHRAQRPGAPQLKGAKCSHR